MTHSGHAAFLGGKGDTYFNSSLIAKMVFKLEGMHCRADQLNGALEVRISFFCTQLLSMHLHLNKWKYPYWYEILQKENHKSIPCIFFS